MTTIDRFIADREAWAATIAERHHALPGRSDAWTMATRLGIEQIVADMRSGRVPLDVPDFASLHDHVDANSYGGAFDWPTLPCDISDELGRDADPYLEAHAAFWDRIQTSLDQLIRSGAMRRMAEEPHDEDD